MAAFAGCVVVACAKLQLPDFPFPAQVNGVNPAGVMGSFLRVTDQATNLTSYVSQSIWNENGYMFTVAARREYWLHWNTTIRTDADGLT